MKKLWKVEYERTEFHSLYVWGETKVDAIQDAEIMGIDRETLDDYDDDLSQAIVVDIVPKGRTAWSGGEDGRDLAPGVEPQGDDA